MAPLAHIHTYVDNMAAQGYSEKSIVNIALSVGAILCELALVTRHQNIHASIGIIPGEDNKMVYAVLQINCLPNRLFLYQLRTHFPQSKPWRLISLLYTCRRQLTTMLHSKKSPRAYLRHYSKNTPLPGANCGASASGCTSPLTSKPLKTRSPSSIFLPIKSAQDFFPHRETPSRINWSSNTSAPLVKYFHPWVPTTPDTTAWENSTFVWDARWCPIRSKIRVRPLPVNIIQALDTNAQGTTPSIIAIRYLTWVSLLFLLQTGKYCKGCIDTAHHPFLLKDFQFFVGHQPYNAVNAPNSVLAKEDFVNLLFTTQNKIIKVESIRNGCNGHPQGCPVAAMRRQVAYL